MAFKQEDIIHRRTEENGDIVLQFPITRKENVEGLPAELAIAAPVGSVIAYAANSDPSGYILCNGAAVSRTTYANLFAKIGTTYGAGDGSTTFNLPNLTDRFIQGSSTAGTAKAAGLPNITGTFLGGKTDAGATDAQLQSGAFKYSKTVNAYDGAGGPAACYNFNASRSSSIYGNSDSVQPPAVTMRYYIKY